MTARVDRLRLNQLLEQARNAPPMTEAELAEQKLSFVRAEMGFGSDAKEAEIRKLTGEA